MTRCTKFTGLLILAVLVVAQAVSAQITFDCDFNPATQSLDYSVSNGAAAAYTLTLVTESGCVQFPGAPDLNGPNDANSVALTCLNPLTAGQLQVDICQGALCFETFTFHFVSDGSCDLRLSPAVSSYSNWSLAGLLLLIVAGGALMIRRRQTVTNE